MAKRLVFIGDSLTQWYSWQRRFPKHSVTNLGIAGEHVEELFARLPDIHVEVEKPDYIFLMIGTNNIGGGDYDIVETYRQIVADLTMHYRTSLLVLQSILPIMLGGIDNARIQDLNLQLGKSASEFNAAYLDIYQRFLDAHGNPESDYFQEDGVHLSSKGYELWANAIEQFLEKHRIIK